MSKLSTRDKEREERSNTYEYGKNHTDEEMLHSLKLALRRSDIEDVANSMQEELIDNVQDRNVKIDLQAHKDRILQLHYNEIQIIREHIEEVSRRLPGNHYGIREALASLARRLDSDMPIQTTCSLCIIDIQMNDSTVFTQRDMNDMKQQGFEEGYDKCLETQSKGDKDLSNRLEQLDLDL